MNMQTPVSTAPIPFPGAAPAYNINVAPILASARFEAGGAIDVLATYRESCWRERKGRSARPWGWAQGSFDRAI